LQLLLDTVLFHYITNVSYKTHFYNIYELRSISYFYDTLIATKLTSQRVTTTKLRIQKEWYIRDESGLAVERSSYTFRRLSSIQPGIFLDHPRPFLP
jgi:hypothetical protein